MTGIQTQNITPREWKELHTNLNVMASDIRTLHSRVRKQDNQIRELKAIINRLEDKLNGQNRENRSIKSILSKVTSRLRL